jgi:CYTH domain-containing protein
MSKLYIDHQTDNRIILAVDHGGKHWEIDVRIDTDEDGGIVAEIGRDSILCTSCEFGWTEKHCNEPQDDDSVEG